MYQYKRLYNIGFAAYAVMLLLAVLFFKERTILSDAAFNLFHIIKDGDLAIQSNRYGEFFTQGIAVLARRAQLSLSGIAISYSASFIVFYLLCYAVCGIALKQYRLALVMLLAQILFVAHTFFYSASQLLQGITFALLTVAFVMRMMEHSSNRLLWLPAIAMIAFSAFFHPLVIVVMAYALVFFLLRSDTVLNRKMLIAMGGIFIAVLAFKAVLIRVQYESHALGGLKNFATHFPDYFTLPSQKRFLTNCLTRYYWLPLVFVAVIVQYYRERKIKRLSFFLVSFFGYLFLVNVSYPDLQTPEFYVENLYLPLGVVLALPFVYDVLPRLDARKLAVATFAAILFTAGVRIANTHGIYTKRLDWERNIVAVYGKKKVILNSKRVNGSILLMPWGNPYEFWLLSTLETGKTASIIVDEKPQDRNWAGWISHGYIVNWNVFPYRELPKKYFVFTDSVNNYSVDPD